MPNKGNLELFAIPEKLIMDRERFETLVARAVDALPDEFRERLENIDIVVEDYPSRSQLTRLETGQGYTLLGLYEGVPLTKRTSYYGMVAPDKITIFQKTIEAQHGNDDFAIQDEIGKVVRHEIAHHFGISDARLSELEHEQEQGQ
jgi:predicted Zn-dependent protease with MMP-like domain